MSRFKYILLSLVLLCAAPFSIAQNTTTCTGTVTDGDGQVWASAIWTAQITNPSGQTVVYTDGTIVPIYSGTLSTGGVFSGAIGDTSKMLPFGSVWRFTVTALTSARSQVLPTFPVTAASNNCGTLVSSYITAPRMNGERLSYAYNTTEITNPVQGNGYVNTISNTQFLYNGVAWVALASGGSGTVGSGTTGQFAFYAANGNVVNGRTFTASDAPGFTGTTVASFFGGNAAATLNSMLIGTGAGQATWTTDAHTTLAALGAVILNPSATQTINQPAGSQLSVNFLNNYFQSNTSAGSIAAIFASAAASRGTVNIPSNNTETGVLTNSNNLAYFNWRMGTTASPSSNLSFGTNNIFMYSVDNSNNGTSGNTCCGGKTAQGIGNFAPMWHVQLSNVGSGTTGAFYAEGDCEDGCDAFHIPTAMVSVAMPGSKPAQLSQVLITSDLSGWDINSCNKVSGVITCSLVNPINARLLSSMVGAGVFINGNSAGNTGASIGIISAASASSITYTTPAQSGTAGPISGGHVGPNHDAWGYELNIFNSNHDPGSTTPVSSQNVNPFHGFTVTGCCGNYPISEGFFANGLEYAGFRSAVSIDGDFIAGDPKAGGGSVGLIGFVARPTQVATNGNNYNSKSITLTNSVWNGLAAESTNVISRKAISPTAVGLGSRLVIDTPTNSVLVEDSGQIKDTDGSASLPTYSFASDQTTGVYKTSGGQVGLAAGGTNVATFGSTSIIPNLAGTGNALLCVHNDGTLYRGTATICP